MKAKYRDRWCVCTCVYARVCAFVCVFVCVCARAHACTHARGNDCAQQEPRSSKPEAALSSAALDFFPVGPITFLFMFPVTEGGRGQLLYLEVYMACYSQWRLLCKNICLSLICSVFIFSHIYLE